MGVKFSIIIPARGLNNYLIENIQKLKSLPIEVETSFEVLLLLETPEDFTNLGVDDRFKFHFVGTKNPGQKRNLGAQLSEGVILAFLDDDAYPSKEWLRRASEIFEDPSVYALGAPALTPLNATFLELCSGRVLESWLASGWTVSRHKLSPPGFVEDYPSVNFFVRKESFNKVGGFSEDFWPGEDTKLCLDLISLYERPFLYDPGPVVYHHRRELFSPYLKQISRYAAHRGQFAKIFPKTSRKLSYIIPSLFLVYTILGGLLALFLPRPVQIIYLSPLFLYLMFTTYEAYKVTVNQGSVRAGLTVMLGIFLTHIVYGINFIQGYFFRPSLQLRTYDKTKGKYIGG